MSELEPIPDEDLLDIISWSLQHKVGPIRALLMQSTSLATCRSVARLQLDHLPRAGVLAYRRPAENHGHHRPLRASNRTWHRPLAMVPAGSRPPSIGRGDDGRSGRSGEKYERPAVT